MDLLQVNTIEQLLDLRYINKSPSIFISKIYETDEKLANTRLVKSYIRAKFRDVLHEAGELPNLCCCVLRVGRIWYHCVYYPVLDSIEVSKITSSSYLYLPTISGGVLLFYTLSNRKVFEVVEYCLDIQKDNFNQLILFHIKDLKRKDIANFVKEKNKNISSICFSTKEKVDFIDLVVSTKDAYV